VGQGAAIWHAGPVNDLALCGRVGLAAALMHRDCHVVGESRFALFVRIAKGVDQQKGLARGARDGLVHCADRYVDDVIGFDLVRVPGDRHDAGPFHGKE
jgi:hypothetical protein